MNKKIGVLAFFTLVGACSADIIGDGMTTLNGQNVDKIFQVWGIPQGEGIVAGKKYFEWTRSFTTSVTTPEYHTANVNTNTSYYGGYGGYGNAYTSGTVNYTTYNTTPINAFCKIRVFVDNKDKIVDWDGDGNEYGCSSFAQRIKPYADLLEKQAQ